MSEDGDFMRGVEHTALTALGIDLRECNNGSDEANFADALRDELWDADDMGLDLAVAICDGVGRSDLSQGLLRWEQDKNASLWGCNSGGSDYIYWKAA